MKISLINNLVYVILIISFISCYTKPIEKQTYIEKYMVSFEDSTFFTGFRMPDSSKSGNFISRISNNISFGGGINFKIPDSLVNKNIKIIFNGKVRANETNTFGHLLAITLNSVDKQLHWQQLEMDSYVKTKDTWNLMKDSTLISADKNTQLGCEIRIFGFNASKKAYMDYDDVEVSFYEVENVIK
jgi:hypothetical protein